MRRLLFLSLLLALLSLLPIAVGGKAHGGEISPELRRRMGTAGADGVVPVIVHFSAEFDTKGFARRQDRKAARRELIVGLREQARRSQAPLQDFLRTRRCEVRELWVINALAAELPPSLIEPLSLWPGVVAVELDGVVPPPAVTPAAVVGAEWNLAAIQAPELWSLGVTGQGVVVATFDTGVDVQHADLSGRWRGGSNSWFDPYRGTLSPYDPNGHGTATMGLLVGGDAGGSAIGVAPGARWISAKIFPDSGGADYSRIHAAFQWALDPDGDPLTDDAPDLVNNSWGFDSTPNQCITLGAASFHSDIQTLKDAGIAVVFSAGNAGPAPATSVSPANNPGALAVGALATDLSVAPFSSRGPSACTAETFPHLVAPGVALRTADLTAGGVLPRSYRTMTGTSFSAPQLSGVAALLLGAFPATSPAQLTAALQNSAADLGAAGPDNDYGFGLVNARAAYRYLNHEPVLSLYDPIAPENDLLLPFKGVTVGGSGERTITLRNSGGGDLALQSIALEPATSGFSVDATACPLLLQPQESCAVSLRFAPPVRGSYSASLRIASDDPDAAITTLGLSGEVSNSSPPAARLISPQTGATLSGTTVTLLWQQGPDPDGDSVTNRVVLSQDADFSQPTVYTVAAVRGGGTAAWAILLAGGMLCCRRKRVWAWGAGVIALLLLGSCGGGDDANGAAGGSRTIANLDPATTYYWKISSSDGVGGETFSEVRRFTTDSE